MIGGIAGVALGKSLATRKQVLNVVFASLVIAVGIYVIARGLVPMMGGV